MRIVILTRILANFTDHKFITWQPKAICNGLFSPFLAGFLLVMSSFAESRYWNLTIFLDKETYKQDNELKFLKSYNTLLPTYIEVLTVEL